MAKAVLIMDMPIDCRHCDLYDVDPGNNFYCGKTKKCIPRNEGKPDWCPLIPEPEREDTRYMTEDEVIKGQQDGSIECYTLGHIDGWNDCLDVLEGKE